MISLKGFSGFVPRAHHVIFSRNFRRISPGISAGVSLSIFLGCYRGFYESFFLFTSWHFFQRFSCIAINSCSQVFFFWSSFLEFLSVAYFRAFFSRVSLGISRRLSSRNFPLRFFLRVIWDFAQNFLQKSFRRFSRNISQSLARLTLNVLPRFFRGFYYNSKRNSCFCRHFSWSFPAISLRLFFKFLLFF